MNYYNENDPFAVAWLRELIKRNVIAPGEVDDRSITEVRASDLTGFIQCHFFAGIGVWSYALRQAGWPDTQRVWTGSCPCQPFSVSGKRGLASDGRHLWPVWKPLIEECRPVTIFGEQVASDDGLAWLDLVSSDLENADYTIGSVDTCAAGFGAPHIRQRLYWVADAASNRTERDFGSEGETRSERGPESSSSSGLGSLADAAESRCGRREGEGIRTDGPPLLATRSEQRERTGELADASGRRCEQRDEGQRPVQELDADSDVGHAARRGSGVRGSTSRFSGRTSLASGTGELGNTDSERGQQVAGSSEDGDVGESGESRLERHDGNGDGGNQPGRLDSETRRSTSTASFWSNCEWLPCRDGKARPVERATQPSAESVADGTADDLGLVCLRHYPGHEDKSEEVLIYSPLIARGKKRVGRLKGYGNAIVAPQATEFIRAYIGVRDLL